jgi:bidirectional [NiFe] hydrogenase diaphorase subunit
MTTTKKAAKNGSPRAGAAHPSGDERYKAIDLTMRRFKHQPDALLEVLNSAQETFGFLSEDLLIYVAQKLNLPLVKVYGVATFYHMFTFEPLGEHETTADGLFSLTSARCIGSCGLAPVVVLDGKVRGKETSEGLLRHVQEVIAVSKEKLPAGGD